MIFGDVNLAKYYAVKKGRTTGIFTTWPEAQKQVSGYKGAIYKSFPSKADAEAFLTGRTQQTMTHSNLTTIVGYTDGGSRNTGNVNGGHVKQTDKAAWAYRLELPGNQMISDSAGEWGATNNRMEIMALIRALEKLIALGQTQNGINMVLDSKYVLDAINQHWIQGWKRRHWQRSAGPLANAELWQQLDGLLNQFTNLTFSWTKGHATNEGNIFVDELLNQTMDEMSATAAPKPSQTKQATKPAASSQTPTKVKQSKPENSPEHTKPVDQSAVNKSVSDIEKALGQLDLFKDL